MEEKSLNFEEKVRKVYRKDVRFFFVRLGMVCLLFLSYLLYFVTPISKVGDFSLTGAYFTTREDIYTLLQLRPSSSLYRIEETEINQTLKAYPFFTAQSQAEVSFFQMKVSVDEIVPCVRYQNQVFTKQQSLFPERIATHPLTEELARARIAATPEVMQDFALLAKQEADAFFDAIALWIGRYQMQLGYVDFHRATYLDFSFYFYDARTACYFQLFIDYRNFVDKNKESYVRSVVENFAEIVDNMTSEKNAMLYPLYPLTWQDESIQVRQARVSFRKNRCSISPMGSSL